MLQISFRNFEILLSQLLGSPYPMCRMRIRMPDFCWMVLCWKLHRPRHIKYLDHYPQSVTSSQGGLCLGSIHFFIAWDKISALDHTSWKDSSFRHLLNLSIVASAVFLAVITSIFFPCRYLLRLFIFERITLSTTKPNTNLKSQIAFSKAILSVYDLGPRSFERVRSAWIILGICSSTAFTASQPSGYDHLVTDKDLSVKLIWSSSIASRKL